MVQRLETQTASLQKQLGVIMGKLVSTIKEKSMNRLHLCDVFDFWKGAVFGLLREAGAIDRLQVLPMFTDAAWLAQELAAYARVLGVEKRDILSDESLAHRRKSLYFEAVKSKVQGDVFIDPDAGISHLPSAKYAAAEDCRLLLQNNMVIVFQYAHRQDAEDWARSQLKKILSGGKNLKGFALACGQAGLLFASDRPARLKKARDVLCARLGPAASGTRGLRKRIIAA
jgi:hypothetical protein